MEKMSKGTLVEIRSAESAYRGLRGTIDEVLKHDHFYVRFAKEEIAKAERPERAAVDRVYFSRRVLRSVRKDSPRNLPAKLEKSALLALVPPSTNTSSRKSLFSLPSIVSKKGKR